MKKINPDHKLRKILAQVPPDYYHRGVKTNVLQQYWHNKKWKKLEKTLGGIGNSKLLDIGCADGTTTHQLHKMFKNMQVNGIDYYKQAVNFAKKTKTKIKFIYADAHDLPFGNNFFEIVTAIETLEHLENPRRALSEIHRVLAPKGHLIIVQDTDSLLFRTIWWMWTKWKGSVWEGSHINCLPPKALVKLVKKAGFEPLTMEYSNFKMEVIIKARKN